MPNWKKLVLYNSDASLNTLTTNAVTGSLLGTASYALNTLTASYVGGVVNSASFASTSSYYRETDPIFTAVSGTFVQTSSFNSFTSSYYADSSSFDSRINSILLDTGSFDSVPIISTVATTTILPRTPVYNNGPSNDGVSAFLSGSTNGVLGAIDGVTVVVGDTILVKNQAAQLQNGVYDIITTGSLSTKYVLRRSTLSDETIEFDPQIVIPSFGTVNRGGIFPQTTNNPVVGVSAIVYTQQTNTLVSQTTTGTQAVYQIPWYTATARQLSKGSNNLKYINVTSGSTVTTSSLVLTGSMILTSGSYSGSGANLFNIPASGIVGLNLSQISSGSVSASISPQNGLQVNTNVTATSFTGSLQGTASLASTASYVDNAQTASYFSETDPVFVSMSGSFATTGSNTFTGNQTINGTIFTDGTITFSNSAFISNTAISGSTYISTLNAGILHLNDDGGEGDIIMLNGQGNKVRTRGNVEVTGSLNVTGGITGSLLGTASNATSSSYSDTSVSASYATSSSRSDNSTSASYSNNSTTASFANTASYLNPLQQNVTVAGNLNIAGTLTAQQYVVSSSVYYVTESFASGSHIFGNSLDDTHQFTGSVLITGSLTASSITGTLVGTASNAQTASFAQTASYVENAQTASHIQGGKATHIPYFIEDTRLTTSSIFQSGSTSIIINQDNNTTANPEALYVWQPNTSSINVISGKGNLDNYLQLNIQNTNQGGDASSDIVATANNGSEFDNYIDMGINSQNFTGFLGGPNDSYLYSHGHNMWIGNINDGYNLHLFNSSSEEPVLTITSDSNVEIAHRLYVSGSITGSLFGTASQAQQATSASYALTASYASNIPATASFAVSSSHAVTASYAANATQAANANTATSASHAVNADTAINANYATTAGNGGVTQIIAGSGISLLPTGGQGAVTVIASGVGGVTIISGSNITASFTNSDTWVFNHNLGVRTPIISVFDSNYNQIIPQNIQLTDTGSATITFPTQESGFVVASLGGATGTVLSSSYALQSTYSTTASYYLETDPIFVSKSGSYATTGSNTFVGNQTVTGSLRTSGSNILVGSTSLTGSLSITGSTLQTGNNTLIGSTTLSGSLEVSGSSNFHNSIFIVTGSAFFSGSHNVNGSQRVTGNSEITGSLNVIGNVNVISGSSFTRWGNKLFNYAQFAETASMPLTQNVSGAFQLPTTYFNDGIKITSGSRITFENTGLYNIQFSAVVNQGAGKPNFSIWFRQTGSNIDNSNTIATIEANSQALLAWNFAYPFAAGSYVEMWYHTTTTNTVLAGTAATNGFPAAPALIVTVTQIA